MANTQILFACLSMVAFLQNQITSFWEIMWIEASKVFKRYVYYLHIKLNIQRISFSFEEIMKAQVSIGYMDFMTKSSGGIT